MFISKARGTLFKWTTEDGTVLRSKKELGDYHAPTAGERAYLADAYEHFGQSCWLVAQYPEDHPCMTVQVRFDDGETLYCYVTDVAFD